MKSLPGKFFCRFAILASVLVFGFASFVSGPVRVFAEVTDFGWHGSDSTGGPDSLPSCQYTIAPSDGTITSMSAKVYAAAGGTLLFAVYDSDGTNSDPKTLLAQDQTGTSLPTVAAAWATSTNISLGIKANHAYWLCTWSSVGVTYYYTDFTPSDFKQTAFINLPTFPNWPASASINTRSNRTFSIYANFTPSGTTKLFGNSHVGNGNGSSNTGYSSRDYCSSASPDFTGTVTSMYAYASSSLATKIGLAIYADDGTGRPGKLLASNAPSSLSPPAAGTWDWVGGNISLPVKAGTTYWLCEWGNNTYTFTFNAQTEIGSGHSYSAGSDIAPGSWETWGNPWSNNTLTANRVLSIYAVYKKQSTIKLGVPTNFLTMNSGLVGWWTFDGNDLKQNAADRSGLGNIGYMQNFTSTSSAVVPGKIGQALNFNALNSTVQIKPDPSSVISYYAPLYFNDGTPWTVSVWVKVNDYSNVLSYMGGDSYYGIFKLNAGADTKKFTFYGADYVNYDFGDSTAYITSGKWFLTTWVSDSSRNITLYVNGVSKSQVSVANSREVFQLINFSGSSHANVIMDDVRVYNRALSAREIKQLYNIGAGAKRSVSIKGPSAGLVGYWTFDGPDMFQNVVDKSGTGNTGYLKGFTSTSSAQIQGVSGQALNFDGVSNCIDAGNGPTLNLTGALSLSAWVKMNTNSWPATSKYVVGRFYNGGVGTQRQFALYTGSLNSMNFTVQPLGITNTFSTYGNTNSIKNGIWMHLVGTYDGAGNIALYVNGVLNSSAASSTVSTLNNPNINVNIGGTNLTSPCGQAYFPGSIDDVRIYNRALSATEVKQLYNLGR